MLIAKKEMSPFVSTVHHQFPSLLQGEHLGQVIFWELLDPRILQQDQQDQMWDP